MMTSTPANLSHLAEVDVLTQVLKYLAYCESTRGVWIPRHCFGPTEIEIIGCTWTIRHHEFHRSGHGLSDLLVAMAECSAPPFPEQCADLKDENGRLWRVIEYAAGTCDGFGTSDLHEGAYDVYVARTGDIECDHGEPTVRDYAWAYIKAADTAEVE